MLSVLPRSRSFYSFNLACCSCTRFKSESLCLQFQCEREKTPRHCIDILAAVCHGAALLSLLSQKYCCCFHREAPRQNQESVSRTAHNRRANTRISNFIRRAGCDELVHQCLDQTTKRDARPFNEDAKAENPAVLGR
jgi:hypothetical protein